VTRGILLVWGPTPRTSSDACVPAPLLPLLELSLELILASESLFSLRFGILPPHLSLGRFNARVPPILNSYETLRLLLNFSVSAEGDSM